MINLFSQRISVNNSNKNLVPSVKSQIVVSQHKVSAAPSMNDFVAFNGANESFLCEFFTKLFSAFKPKAKTAIVLSGDMNYWNSSYTDLAKNLNKNG